MKCGGCEATITKALEAINGVLKVKASHQDKKVDIEFDAELTDLDTLEDAITDAGFSVD
jgi:copper chaperone CopZ